MTLANWLTLSRIAAIPLLVTLLYVPGPVGAWTACAVFCLAGFTDWLDGHLARTRNQGSDFGRMMDPIADKLLVASALLVMVATGKIEDWAVLAALVILCREILVSGLREYLAGLKVGLPVSRLAKWKTGLQMVSIGVLIVGADGPAWLPVLWIGEIGLWGAAILTLWTGWDYLRAGIGHADTTGRPASLPEGR
ncbi:MAG: CDP-diacylglycerol--glycerol-3-phosphate 3-phosphatidyltransferase [Alphaproteobacteria bacterium]|nr:CDP-diacylglycerol--glycerol-3-phosphate 3-phosphatidyltransferase [Alphaproteobacteria bacterium]TAD91470.1 MAG: CDP-diacylglycerol--glycerol-3-phosphate 3-phosphatidyltransferase [Alphaproteobacteria bacterium]